MQSEKDKYDGDASQKKKSRSRSRSREDRKKKSEKKSLKWVVPGIIVRMVSKKAADGKLYNKKLRIVDVHDRYTFSAALIEGG